MLAMCVLALRKTSHLPSVYPVSRPEVVWDWLQLPLYIMDAWIYMISFCFARYQGCYEICALVTRTRS